MAWTAATRRRGGGAGWRASFAVMETAHLFTLRVVDARLINEVA